MKNHTEILKNMLKIIRELPRSGFAETTVTHLGNRLYIDGLSYSLEFVHLTEHSIYLQYRMKGFGLCWCEIDLETREVFFRLGLSNGFVFKRKAERLKEWVTHIKRLHVAALLQA